jgi:hypothetical protein
MKATTSAPRLKGRFVRTATEQDIAWLRDSARRALGRTLIKRGRFLNIMTMTKNGMRPDAEAVRREARTLDIIISRARKAAAN